MSNKIKFKIEVNPFLKKVVINTKLNNITYTIIRYYFEVDEWGSFNIDDKVFDIHYHYDDEFSISVYKVVKNKIDYNCQYDVELMIKLTDL